MVIEDRCSRRLSLNLVMTKTAPEVYAAMNSVLDGKEVKTITIDQGREFVLTERAGVLMGVRSAQEDTRSAVGSADICVPRAFALGKGFGGK